MNQDQRQGWRAWLKGHRLASFLVVSLILIFVAIAVLGYWLRWSWTGLVGTETEPTQKTAWDWMGLLIIPAVLGAGAYLFNRSERNSDREIAADRNQEELVRTYLDSMSELLMRWQLRDDRRGLEARYLARARTLTVLRSLTALRRSTIIQFLSDSSLIDGKILNLSDISLDHTDLHEAHLGGAALINADLRETNLDVADLTGADLRCANLDGASLIWAELFRASLIWASLVHADLDCATLTGADLGGANLSYATLTGATLTGANLSYANLTGVKNVTIEQLCAVKTLYEIVGLDADLMEQVKEQCPHLLEAPKDEG